jgi:alpha-glucosidase (family GH31 glycosyl hydrolase)
MQRQAVSAFSLETVRFWAWGKVVSSLIGVVQTDRMGSGQAAYHLSTHGARVPIQLTIGTSGWAMYIHQPLGIFDLSGGVGRFQTADTAKALPLDLFLIGSDDPKTILAEYAKITGYPEMVPLWSLGYQQSHRTLGPPEEILQEAKTFRDKKLPCDAMIYLGTGFCPNGWNTDNGEFAWNPKAFPHPSQAIHELHKEHFKVVLHVVLEGQRLTGSVSDPCTASLLPSGRTPDHHWPPDRQVSCYWPVHKPLLDLGIDGWWPDQGDGLDAPSRLARNRMYFEGTQMYRPNERVYALHRNGYAGMQRYAAFLWSGDVQSRWETLKTHVPIGINSGLSGIPYWGTDIGGFIPTQEYTGELFVRWFQFAAFNPLFRSHGRDWRLHLPWGWTVGEIGYPETPTYHPDPADLHNPAIEPICKTYLELRYQLLPYIYSIMKETCETGLPLIRSLWIHYPVDSMAVARGDEYLFGRDILVAPVVEKGVSSRTLYLPRGVWYDFWTQEKLEGGREISRPVDLKTMPLYVRAGAVLPMGPMKQYSDEKVDSPLTLSVHPGADGVFALYEDDGKTFNYRKGEYMQVEISWRDRTRQLSLRLARGSKMLEPAKRTMHVKVVGETASRDIQFDGQPITVKC